MVSENARSPIVWNNTCYILMSNWYLASFALIKKEIVQKFGHNTNKAAKSEINVNPLGFNICFPNKLTMLLFTFLSLTPPHRSLSSHAISTLFWPGTGSAREAKIAVMVSPEIPCHMSEDSKSISRFLFQISMTQRASFLHDQIICVVLSLYYYCAVTIYFYFYYSYGYFKCFLWTNI